MPAGLEGGDLQVEFSAGSPAEFKNILAKLSAAAESASLAEIFILLKGRAMAKPRAAADCCADAEIRAGGNSLSSEIAKHADGSSFNSRAPSRSAESGRP